MKKRYLSLLLLLSILSLLILTLAGCDNTVYHWKFDYGYEEISRMTLVEITSYWKAGYVEIQEIDLSSAEDVYNDITNLEMTAKFGTNYLAPRGWSFLIVFKNGDYSLITQVRSVNFKHSNDTLESYMPRIEFDVDEYNALFRKYLKTKTLPLGT